ncbi:EAL domain-containing protein [Neptuniibacter sp. 2_MG-2023]|uniref:EAL domain-containing protein n=1 Tax=Neptuniibacter sp. 2_MG-2023 TaxID=3062671 RepID=UPI0026E1C8DA|nr:EAL domain-containing protein [Neptuniibacter sp. 2_MG-2023]MDO6512748.1 EAL domain-containing protein [Neptuniibacter sp. 2_MG-2023]
MNKRRIQLFVIGFMLLLLVVSFNSSVLKRIDLIIYDTLLNLSSHPAPEEIVIIAIDEESIIRLGRWPWPRTTHAELLNQLTQAQTTAVGFDILFSEKESLENDRLFAEAIEKNGHVFLAVAPEKSLNSQITELLPTPTIAEHSAGFAHVDTELDIDGICRRVYLYAGLGDAHWPILGLALQQAIRDYPLTPALEKTQSSDTGWVRKTPLLIPFYGPPGHFTHYSYIDVLNGKIGREHLKDKIVIIGATATGMGDAVSTPVSGHHQRMPGVELNANIAAALLESRFITEITPWQQYLSTLILTTLLVLAAIVLPKRYFPISLPFTLLAALVLSFTLLREAQLWLPPTNTMLVLILVFSLFSWRRSLETQYKLTQLNNEVYQQLNFDPITHLPNKTMFKDQLASTLTETPSTQNVSLLIIQLSGIKEVNNRLGLNAGDEILAMAAQQIQKAVGFSYPVARLSGIEFATIITNQSSPSDTARIGHRLIQLLQLPCELQGDHFFFKPSIGVSTYPQDGDSTDILISNAYAAMHKAKSNNKRGLYYYSLHLKQEIIDESSLTRDLHLALNQNQLEVYYQPQVISATGEIIGLEALLRWKHPERGNISPASFIPIAEKTGLIMPIGDWVLETACKQAVTWNKGLKKEIRIAINISAIQFYDNFIVERVKQILDITALPAHLLELELTESALMSNFETTIQTLHELKDIGINIAVDDFGTGYSSLSYLKQFPLDRIKIDQSFVRDLGQSVESAEITQAIITMAHSLNLQVIAEGVETPQQRNFLLTQTCEELQGFLFSKPLPKAQISELLKSPRELGSPINNA